MIFVYLPVSDIILFQVSHRCRRKSSIRTVRSLKVVICAYLRTKLAYIRPLLFSFMRFEKRRRIYFTSYPRESSAEFKGIVYPDAFKISARILLPSPRLQLRMPAVSIKEKEFIAAARL